MIRFSLPLLLGLLPLLVAGCGKAPLDDIYTKDAAASDYGDLRLSRLVNDPQIRQQMATLEAAGQLPPQLAQKYRQQTDAATEEKITDFFRGDKPSHIEDALAESASWWNPRSPGNDLLVATQGNAFLRKWDIRRITARSLLNQSRVRLPVNLESGHLADPTWIGTVHCLARAELLAAASHAQSGDLNEAVTAVAFAMAHADQLTQAPLVAARNAAAAIREECYGTLRALLRHPALAANHLRTLETVFEQSHRRWPAEVPLWQADRTAGLHFFEMVRAGHFASLLTREEYEALKESGELATMTAGVQRNVTRDQAFYLNAMQQVIELAEKPYNERVEGLTAIYDALSQARSAGDYPVISGDFLLNAMHAQHASLAKDQARLITWMTAPQLANGHAPKTLPTSPYTGRPIPLQEEATRVVVPFDDLPGEIPPLVVPKLSD